MALDVSVWVLHTLISAGLQGVEQASRNEAPRTTDEVHTKWTDLKH